MGRMFVEGDFDPRRESERMAANRLMRELDDAAAKDGVAVAGDVTILGSEPHVLTGHRTMRLEADVVTR